MRAKPQSEEYERFEGLLGKVLAVPKAEISRRIEEDRRDNPKSSSHVAASQTKRADQS